MVDPAPPDHPPLTPPDWWAPLSDDKHADVKVVMVTTETEMPRMIAALEAGANEYLMKPFTKESLREKLSMVGIEA